MHNQNNSHECHESSEDERPFQTLMIPPSSRKRKRITISSEDEAAVVDSRAQKYVKLNDSHSAPRGEEVRYCY